MGGYGGYYGGHGLVYGKRSADAEPKADADPWLTYGRYYGHGLGHYEDTVLVLAMVDTMAATDWSMARGLLMLSPRLMLIPTFSMEDMEDMEDITDLAMPVMVDTGLDTEDTTGDKSSHCHTCSLLNDNHISIGK